MDLIQRIAAKDENFSYDSTKNLIEILDKYLLEYSFESIFNLIVPTLSKMNYLECQNKKEPYYDFIIYLSYLIADNRFQNNYHNQIITLFTRTNGILIINYLFFRQKQFGNKNITYRDLFYLLLILNNFEEDTTPDLNTLPNKEKKINFNDVKKIAANIIKSAGFQNISLLRLPNIDRSYKMINELLKTQEGIICNNDFKNKYGFDIHEYFRITWATYHFMYLNYMNDNFSNIIDFDSLFKHLVSKDSPEQKLKPAFIKVFEKLCSSPTTPTQNDICLYNTGYLWYNNIKKIKDGTYQIIDIGLFITAAFTNIFLTFEDPYLSILQKTSATSTTNPLRANALGTCFENFSNELFNNFSQKKELCKYYKGKKGQAKNEIADIFFKIDDSLFFIECKAGYLKVQDIVNKTPEELIDIIFKKYGGQYKDEDTYKKLPSNEKKGTIQIMHNYVRLNEALKNNDFSIYDNSIELENELKTVKKVYGIVLIEEPYLSSFGLNNVLYKYNSIVTNKLYSKIFYPPIYVYVNDLYKIIYNKDIINEKKLTFEQAIKEYLNFLRDKSIPKNLYSFHDYLVNEWNAPVEIGEKESKDLTKKLMNDLYQSVGIEIPND